MISSILDHKNVALANIGWALLHVWIALEIEESMGFLAIVLVIGGIFALSWRLEGKNGRRIMLLPSRSTCWYSQPSLDPSPGRWSPAAMLGWT